ncbi:MAG: hypothetical protein KF862_16490 [Chitinophagaceae bacterium]|nr:hypothetical protein [Chitinophagaceae bacterium]
MDIKKPIIFFCLGMLLVSLTKAQSFIAEGRHPLAVLPVYTSDIPEPVTSLDGEWEINMNPSGEVWKTNEGNWQKIQVPGEPAMQGFKVTNDKEFFYRQYIDIPSSAKGKNIRIRFNGVYSYARVFVNGNLVREHFGGFTAWEADLTDYVQPGKRAIIHVGVTDRADDISYASGYAHHPVGGILRKVQLVILPREHINRFYVNTDLSNDLKVATVNFDIANNISLGGSKINLQLLNAAGSVVANKMIDLNNNGQARFSLTVNNPVLWNQEQPYLYTAKIELVKGKRKEQIIVQQIGIRKVEVKGTQVLVNGQPVKLRGACRHDMHPTLGRSTNRYYDSLDIALAKEANINFIRTSHYPPTDDFLEFADKMGIYVQEETAICFVLDWREGIYAKNALTQDDTAYTSRYLGQLSEMIDRDRNHASVIMWSIGNESWYGSNFQKEYDFVKSVDKSRPVAWSFPTTALDKGKKCFDILISHYPKYNGATSDLGKYEKDMVNPDYPVLGDEWAHVACYNVTMLKNDPNVKDYWGRSLDSMWLNRFDVKGNLGGAIWGMIDETFHLPDTVTGYGPWGFIDVWRRKKTEFWNTRKAYSPVKVLTTNFNTTVKAVPISIPVKNRYNHINLDEITLKVTQKGKTTSYKLPALEPHEEGIVTIKPPFADGELMLRFYDRAQNLIDEEMIEIGAKPGAPSPKPSNEMWNIAGNDSVLILRSNNKEIRLHKSTGQLLAASVNGEKVIDGAIRFTLFVPDKPNVLKESGGKFTGDFIVGNALIDQSEKNKITIKAEGSVDKYPIQITSAYYADGRIETTYFADSIPKQTWQIGVAIPIADAVNNYEWKRKGYWTTYPKDHLSAHEGTAHRYTNVVEQYRVKPGYPVAFGMHDYYLTGTNTAIKAEMPGSEIYRAAKENILSMTIKSHDKAVMEVVSDGKQAGKISILPNGKQELLVLNKLDYWVLSWGNYQGTVNASSEITGKVSLSLK